MVRQLLVAGHAAGIDDVNGRVLGANPYLMQVHSQHAILDTCKTGRTWAFLIREQEVVTRVLGQEPCKLEANGKSLSRAVTMWPAGDSMGRSENKDNYSYKKPESIIFLK